MSASQTSIIKHAENTSLIDLVAKTSAISTKQVETVIQLLNDGNTVPFIARYRKQLTQSLDDTQLRLIEEKVQYFRELIARKASILKAIEKQGKLTSAINNEIQSIEDKVTLEHSYAPFKTTRISKSQQAIEAGLLPLSEQLWKSPRLPLQQVAKHYVIKAKGIENTEQALTDALAIQVEKISQEVSLIGLLKKHLQEQATLTSRVIKTKVSEATKFKDYFDFSARLTRLPAHRILAMLRGKSEGYLRLKIEPDPYNNDKKQYSYCQTLMAKYLNIYLDKHDHDSWHRQVIDHAWRMKILPSLERQMLVHLKTLADAEAINQFANNLNALLMAPPAGEKVILGLDPGFKSGCKLAVISGGGELLSTATIYPHQPQMQSDKASQIVINLLKRFHVKLIAIGNGTASRESEHFINNLLTAAELDIDAISVSEAGASVYSASKLAANEFPDLDVTLRGAVSIARRLQDPLSELVKIDAKAIGVGLYQHDVQQTLLAEKLQGIVEDCVNKVGVDLNTASPYLLAHVAGLNQQLATNIVEYRHKNGRFTARNDLLAVPRLGAKSFQQAAGFLTVKNGSNCLDQTILHPEQYALAKKVITFNQQSVDEVVNNPAKIKLTLPKVNDSNIKHEMLEVINILQQERRDPRSAFISASFDQNINKITDLEPGLSLQGVVTNVANFGAFVDLGVHQDGLVHISMLSDGFVDDPHKIVKVNQIVNVKVESVDIERKRIALTMKNVVQPN
ncbi:Tex family protein [Psychromonas aquatilis]|uniref:Tex family protein n=1 Tax=Psychromonas aquatilis TaxID=2005072 RepID=A0ABU9GMM3_9GAMM